ncbi:Pr6Pr family membrane protein [Nocardia sp. NBC_01503]|uniref:Pr6Pr family membrane protein n=1 Tax=Nocardia sp. NBC_01503 TaxID=2975997 RepID=UPI002E7AF3E7|nr:Pr6Pr family membrane protein [Nocardia sp. NBC_01503]WTL29875.1 Pr6Pr family membrane protein [Nocardia sp. NBC_01503]
MVATAGTPMWVRVPRIAFGLFALVALVDIPVRNIGVDGYSYTNFFSYFTIQSNILGVLVLLVGGLRDPGSRGWQLFRGAGTLYLTITGIIYAVLLADVDVQMDGLWTNAALHKVMPLVILLDWLIIPAGIKVTPKLIGWWLIYPIAYGVYTLIRGPIVDWYPYPFIDPRTQGYLAMSGKLVVIVLFFVILAAAVAALNGFLVRFWRESRTHVS